MVKYPELFDKDGHIKPVELPGQKLFGHMILGNEIGTAVAPILSTITDFLSTFDNSDDAISIDKGGSTIHFHERFLNELNQAVQNEVHALDGYYLFEPLPITVTNVSSFLGRDSDSDFVKSLSRSIGSLQNNYSFIYFVRNDSSSYNFYAVNCNKFYIVSGGDHWVSVYDSNLKSIDICGEDDALSHDYDCIYMTKTRAEIFRSTPNYYYNFALKDESSVVRCFGVPFKVFYSYTDLRNYLNKGRIYAPQLPSTTISIPIKYINNSVSLPDITYNINTTNKTEVEIQNEYNTTLNNYLDDLNKFSDGGGGNTPTPTPSGGGSGDFGDGSTPTPTPPLGDGGSDQDGDGSDGWLKKIYDQLVKLSDSVSQHFEKEETFEDKLSKYLESHDKKLDGIVDAIDKLSQGKEEGEEKGCKYDYTELSDFMTKLWNDSDQKFDQMVELLKENNEYQEKMLSTLNSIKNILKAQTVMDAFKNRSSETANKAKEKFPTSVPWDVGLLVNAMDAEPKAPVFELPIKIERLNIDEKITVDISSGEWEKLAKACRYMLSLLFVLFMVNLTRKLFFSKGDD
nr:MAG TPA: hypothetical protein [Inoviridae sp.]